MAISVTVELNRTGTALATLARGVKDRSVVNRQIAAQFFSWVQRNFDEEGGLSTRPWVPLRPSTVAEKARLGYSPKMLVRTGNLRQSFQPFSDQDQAGIGARASFGVDYAQVHEEGGGNVPARPMLPSIGIAEDYVTRIYGRFIAKRREEAGL